MAKTALKHEHMASKFNPDVKITEMCLITESHIAHDLFNYFALILCLCIQKQLSEYLKTILNNGCRTRFPVNIYDGALCDNY